MPQQLYAKLWTVEINTELPSTNESQCVRVGSYIYRVAYIYSNKRNV
jgi:hypothetical protein